MELAIEKLAIRLLWRPRKGGLTNRQTLVHNRQTYGGLAQLGERLHGMQEVIGSSPLSSINCRIACPAYQRVTPRVAFSSVAD